MIFVGDAQEVLSALYGENSFHCCVTSPPYWGLRDYGVIGQLGLEKTPEEYIAKMVEVFREVKRVLKPDGTLWLNIGDSYSNSGRGGHSDRITGRGKDEPAFRSQKTPDGLKPKDLVGIPWRIAFALQKDGWYLRQDIIWQKPNSMPESVKDRCTKSHEYIFLLSKSPNYYFDYKAIQVPAKPESIRRMQSSWNGNENRNDPTGVNNHLSKYYGSDRAKAQSSMRNKRSVWTVTTKSFKDAHFATFPPDLIEPCILAGCPKNGIILDPFIGAGTTGLVAEKFDRRYIGIELNPAYAAMASKRIDKGGKC